MFFSASALNSSNGDVDLVSVFNINTANAECLNGGFMCCE